MNSKERTELKHQIAELIKTVACIESDERSCDRLMSHCRSMNEIVNEDQKHHAKKLFEPIFDSMDEIIDSAK